VEARGVMNKRKYLALFMLNFAAYACGSVVPLLPV
jgi:hypothetical protein